MALITEDFAAYYSILEEAQKRGIYLLVLSPKASIPAHVGVVITTGGEYDRIVFTQDRIVIIDESKTTLDRALKILRGFDYKKIIIGIDPGKYPGIAILRDNKVDEVYHVSVSDVYPVIERVIEENKGKEIIVRIGHGARLTRSQIVNSLIDMGISVELVDETGTTPRLGKGVHGQAMSDIIAAINIALLPGKPAYKQYIEPSRGEVRVIQERSRNHSNGRTTITRKLAKKVAKGELTLDEAVEEHNGSR